MRGLNAFGSGSSGVMIKNRCDCKWKRNPGKSLVPILEIFFCFLEAGKCDASKLSFFKFPNYGDDGCGGDVVFRPTKAKE